MAVVLWFLVWGSSTGEPKVTVRAAANRPAGQRAGHERKWVASIVWLLPNGPFSLPSVVPGRKQCRLPHSQGVYAKMKQYTHCDGGAGMCRLLQGLSQHGPCQACRDVDVVDIHG